jgi:membrane-associated protease RseP (regulator of RpoE activity)
MILLFVFSLILCIFIHESAHLIISKIVGCEVEVFSIGFWKPVLFSKKIGNTVYQITPWLLGGYCQLKGELSVSESLSAFTNLRYSKKLAISLAGVFINIILGITLMIIAFKKYNFCLFYFGYINFILGVGNLLPIPALDGSYPFLMLLEKIIKKEKAIKIVAKIVTVFFTILMISQLILLPWFITKGFKQMNEQIRIMWQLITHTY